MSVPQGLAFTPDFITVEREVDIISWLDTRPWLNDLTRRTQHFGYGYNYKNKKLVPAPPLEGPVLDFANVLSATGIINPVQCIVNEYTRNQGIAGHIDNLSFGGIVLGLSIAGDAVMTFERARTGHPPERFDLFLPRRSLVMLSGEARYEWTHSIDKRVTYIDNTGRKVTKPQDYRRISLTYRELAVDK